MSSAFDQIGVVLRVMMQRIIMAWKIVPKLNVLASLRRSDLVTTSARLSLSSDAFQRGFAWRLQVVETALFANATLAKMA